MSEPASMTFVQNMDFDTFRFPENLDLVFNYLMHGDVEDDGAGGLKWKESSDRVGHFEYTYGEGPRQRERSARGSRARSAASRATSSTRRSTRTTCVGRSASSTP